MYALHFLLPFIVLAGLVVHLAMLHTMGSGSASTTPGTTVDGEAFLLYYYKDGIPYWYHGGAKHTLSVVYLVYSSASQYYEMQEGDRRP